MYTEYALSLRRIFFSLTFSAVRTVFIYSISWAGFLVIIHSVWCTAYIAQRSPVQRKKQHKYQFMFFLLVFICLFSIFSTCNGILFFSQKDKNEKRTLHVVSWTDTAEGYFQKFFCWKKPKSYHFYGTDAILWFIIQVWKVKISNDFSISKWNFFPLPRIPK